MQRLERAAIHLENKWKEKLGTKGGVAPTRDKQGRFKASAPMHSAPGEYPFLQSGELRRSITHEMDTNKLIGRVGSNVVYSRYLWAGTSHMAARKMGDDVLQEEWPTIRALITGSKIL